VASTEPGGDGENAVEVGVAGGASVGDAEMRQGGSRCRSGRGVADEEEGEPAGKGESLADLVAEEEAGHVAADLGGTEAAGEHVGAAEEKLVEQSAVVRGGLDPEPEGAAFRVGRGAV